MPSINDLPSISTPAEDSVVVVTDALSSKKITILDLRNTLVRQASSTVAGSVKVGSGLTISENGTLSVTNFSGYSLPAATRASLGGVIVGAGLSINSNGVLSVSSVIIPEASEFVSGTVKVGSGLRIVDGVLSSQITEYVLPSATQAVLGGVKVGSGLVIDHSVLSTEAKPFATEGDPVINENYTTPENKTIYSIGSVTIGRSYTVTVSNNSSWTVYTPGVSANVVDTSSAHNPIREQDTVITANYSISAGKIATSVGPITIDKTVTVEVSGNSTWFIF